MDSDDDLSLSAESLAALAAFSAEREEQQEAGEVAPDFQLSQFWYSDATAAHIAAMAGADAGESEGRAAFVSSPSAALAFPRGRGAVLFEFDRRFLDKVGAEEFAFYDYNAPDAVDGALVGQFAYVVADPPHLSEECLGKTLATMRLLARPGARLIFLTGMIMRDFLVGQQGFVESEWRPEHEQNLQNEFGCFLSRMEG